jgi:Histidine phosphatase superfamily (branch 2)
MPSNRSMSSLGAATLLATLLSSLSPVSWFLLLLLSSSSPLVGAEPALTEIYVITRHGSRLPLTKDAETLDEGGPGTLTFLGQMQHYELGLWLRERYNNNITGSPGFFDAFYSPRVNLTSSSLHRTVVSANSMLYGLFPTPSRDPRNESFLPYNIPPNVPVMTERTDNDVTIRGYEKCEAGLGLDDLYASKEWKDLENENLSLLESLGGIEVFTDYQDPLLQRVPLEELWNVYDAIAVSKIECESNPNSISCQISNPSLQTIVSDDEWTVLKNLAFKAELMKYSSKRGGNVPTGNLVKQILDRMKEAELASTLTKFYLYSAHYPTILGVLAALDSDPSSDPPLVPDFAAALILELYTDIATSQKTVRVWYKQGYANDTAQEVVLGRSCNGTSPCDIRAVEQSFMGDFTAAKWCQKCQNNKADICVKANLTSTLADEEGTTAPPPAETPSTSSTNSDSLGFVPALFIGLFAGMAITLVGMVLVGKVRKQRSAVPVELEAEHETPVF